MSTIAAISFLIPEPSPSPSPSKQEMEEAYDLFMAFTKTENCNRLCGSLSALKDSLVKAYDDVKGSAKHAFPVTGLLISQIIEQAEDTGLLDERVATVYFAEGINQVALTDRIAKGIIESVTQQENRNDRIRQKAQEIRNATPSIAHTLGHKGTIRLAASFLHLPYKKV